MAIAGDTIRTMIFARSTVSRQGRWITSVLVAALLLMQFALAAYACPKLDSAAHAASMQKAGMAMEDAVGMPSMPDCHAMAGTMDEQDPQLCRAHCDGDSLSSPLAPRSRSAGARGARHLGRLCAACDPGLRAPH